MQHDDMIWGIIKSSFCSFKADSRTQHFCRNEYNLTGLCSRSSCPLANSQYATVREEDGICYLYMKTVERAAFPSRMWEKVRLSQNIQKAIRQISEELVFWPGFIIQKCKQRFLRITQYLIRMRRLKLKPPQQKLIPVAKKIERREAKRQKMALNAAKIENHIEKELLQRLKHGTYEGIYNFPQAAFDKALDQVTEEEDIELEDEQEVDINEEVEQELEVDERYFVEDFDESDEDIEDIVGESPDKEDSKNQEQSTSHAPSSSRKPQRTAKLKKKRSHMEVEYEMETEPRQKVKATN